MSFPFYDDYDSRWNEPDERMVYLHNQIKQLKLDTVSTSPDIASIRGRLNEMDRIIEKIEVGRNLLLLHAIGVIDTKRVKTIVKMFRSEDKENEVLAIEAIRTLTKEHLT